MYKKKRTENCGSSIFKGRAEEEKMHAKWEKPEVWKENREAANHGGQGKRIFQNEGQSQCFECCKEVECNLITFQIISNKEITGSPEEG